MVGASSQVVFNVEDNTTEQIIMLGDGEEASMVEKKSGDESSSTPIDFLKNLYVIKTCVSDWTQISQALDKVHSCAVKMVSRENILVKSEALVAQIGAEMRAISTAFQSQSAAIKDFESKEIVVSGREEELFGRENMSSSRQLDELFKKFKAFHQVQRNFSSLSSEIKDIEGDNLKVISILNLIKEVTNKAFEEQSKLLKECEQKLQDGQGLLEINSNDLKRVMFPSGYNRDLDALFNRMVQENVKQLVKERESHLEKLAQLRDFCLENQILKNFLFNLNRFISRVEKQLLLKQYNVKNQISHLKGRLHGKVNSQYVRLYQSLSARLTIFVRFEQLRISNSMGLLGEARRNKEKHLFLYEETELSNQLADLNRHIIENEKVIQKCRSNLNEVADKLEANVVDLFEGSNFAVKVKPFLRTRKGIEIGEIKNFIAEVAFESVIESCFSCCFGVLSELNESKSRLFQLLKDIINFIAFLHPNIGHKGLYLTSSTQLGKRKYGQVQKNFANEAMLDVMNEMRVKRAMTSNKIHAGPTIKDISSPQKFLEDRHAGREIWETEVNIPKESSSCNIS